MSLIRRVEEKDMQQLVELFDAYRVFYEMPSNKELAYEFLSERFLKNESIIFVSEDRKNTLTGFIQLYPIFSSTRLKRLWLLNDLFVDEKYRGLGISKDLIAETQKFCLKSLACGLILETSKSNKIANTLYSKMAFEIDNAHNYYEWIC